MKASEIRRRFADFFVEHGHKKYPSSSLVPHNDPTLLFTNAGMVQFKDYFTGKAQPQNKRVVTIQKCVRAGGKHNDLENVGFTARHHTFFEMLGNFSFGDYFKEEAITMAWKLLTEVFKIPTDRLYVTAHHTDQEAAKIWREKIGVPENHFFFRGDKDNFWEMGETGPCGPCSEIFYDHGVEHSDPHAKIKESVLDDEQRFVEIWNLVFMQFERYREDGKIKQRPLPNPSIDTGSGLERVATVLQGVYNNYDTDIFSGIIAAIEKFSGKSYSDERNKTSLRVVADHARAATMLITDGVLPSNEGRGYVLRRIIRRAVRYLHTLGVEDLVMHKLVGPVLDSFAGEYPDNKQSQPVAEKYLKTEEQNFRRTLTSGLNLLEREIARLKSSKKDTLEGSIVFSLYDSHGFPVDLTELILREQGLKMDHQSFEALMEEQKSRSRSAGGFDAKEDNLKSFYQVKEQFGETKFTGYEALEGAAKLLKVIALGEGQNALIFDRTPFYGESGGQAGDQGEILLGHDIVARVLDTQKPVDGVFAHIVKDAVKVDEGKTYTLRVDRERRAATAKNHTATHLLHAALRSVLGAHVRQAGSAVSAERLRFDFSHPEAISKEQLRQVEHLVNSQIFRQTVVCPRVVSKDQALKEGAMALFGEKYGNEVRMIGIEGFSLELCGGTHVKNTTDIGLFTIVSESSVAAGVRRIEAITGSSALKRFESRMQILGEVESVLNAGESDALERLENLQKSLKEKEKELKTLREKQQARSAEGLFENPVQLKDGSVFKSLHVDDGGDLKQIGDLFLDRYNKGTVLITSKAGDKASILLKTFKGNSSLNCSDLLKKTLSSAGGRGGGKPDMAQGSVDLAKLKEVEASISSAIKT